MAVPLELDLFEGKGWGLVTNAALYVIRVDTQLPHTSHTYAHIIRTLSVLWYTRHLYFETHTYTFTHTHTHTHTHTY